MGHVGRLQVSNHAANCFREYVGRGLAAGTLSVEKAPQAQQGRDPLCSLGTCLQSPGILVVACNSHQS